MEPTNSRLSGSQAQAGIAGAQIVQGDGKAHGAVVVQGAVEQVKILDRGLLGQLDHHPLRCDAATLQQLQGASGLVARFDQRFGRDVQVQRVVAAMTAVAGAGAGTAGHFQFTQPSGIAGHGKQGERCMQRAVRRPPAEGLETVNASSGEGEDRLEQGVELVVGEDSLQFAQLFGGGHAVLGSQ